MNATPVFRKVSLDRLSSPEQLDQLMQVTDPRGWLALSALGVMVLLGVLWGVFGTVTETVAGPGMLIKSGGVFEVVPSAGGRVVDLSVEVGDVVREGQVVARIAQPDLTDRLHDAKSQLAALRDEHTKLLSFARTHTQLDSDYTRQQQDNVAQAIASLEQTMRLLRERMTNEEQLVAQGLLTKATLFATQQQYESARQKVNDSRSQLTQLASSTLNQSNEQRQRIAASATKIEQQDAAVRGLERQYDASSRVIASYTGRVLEILASEGSIVRAGEAVLSLDLLGSSVKRLEAVVFVPSSNGKQIRKGMTIQVSPSTVKQEEYGFMVGRVTYVSDFPATERGMQRVLQNDRLVASLAGQGAPYEIRADLVVDPTTVSQYKWSSSSGPPLKVQSGTVATGNIEIESRRPISLVFPTMRRIAGL